MTFFLKDVFIVVDKSLLMLLSDNTKMLANTGNRSGKLQRWANHTEQSETFGKQKTKEAWINLKAKEQGAEVLSIEPGLDLQGSDSE